MSETTSTTSPNTRTVVFSRQLDAPRETVWQAWTTPENVERWWGPPGCETFGCEIDLRVSGVFSLMMRTPDGSVFACRGVIREVDAPRRLAIAGDDDIEHPCGAGLPPGALVILSLEDIDGERTALRLETRFETDEEREAANAHGYSASWPPTIDRLAALLAGPEA